jgi:hypothetical protein
MGSGDDKVRLGATLSNSDSVDGGDGTDTVFAQVNAFSRNLNTTNVETATLTFGDNAGGTVNASGSTVTTVNAFVSGGTNDVIISNLDAGTINLVDDTIDDVTVGYEGGTVVMNVGSASGSVAIDDVTASGATTFSLIGNGGTAGAGSVGDITLSDATTVTVGTNGNESDLTVDNLIAKAATTLTVTSQNSGAITLTSAMEVATAIETITMSAVGSGADVTVGALFGSGVASNISQITLDATDADIAVGAITLGNGGVTAAATDFTLTLNAHADANVGTSGLDISATGDINITIDVDANAASADVTVGDIIMDAGTAATGQLLTIDALTIGTAGTVEFEEATMLGSGGQVVIDTATVGKDANFHIFSSGGISADGIDAVDVSKITVNLAASGATTMGGATGSAFITTTGGTFGGLEITVADDASADVGIIRASSIGAITVDVGVDGGFDIGSIGLTAGSVDDIYVDVESSASATFNTINASAVGSITVVGAGVVEDIDIVSAGTIGTIDSTGMVSGATFTINLDGVETAAEVNLGVGTNTVTSGKGNDVITLTAGRTAAAGNDTIKYDSTGQGNDNIINFIAGAAASGGDKIQLDTDALAVNLMAGNGSAAASEVIADYSGSASSMAAATTIIRYTTALDASTDLISAMKADITLASACGSSDFAVLWSDGNGDTYVSVVSWEASSGSASTTLGGDGASAMTVTTLATLDGVTPSALVAANLEFI